MQFIKSVISIGFALKSSKIEEISPYCPESPNEPKQ